MASSSVRENVNLTITPTFDGVCGMLFYIILVLIFIAKFEYMSVFFEYFWTNFLLVEVTDVIVIILNQWKFLADVVCHMLCNG